MGRKDCQPSRLPILPCASVARGASTRCWLMNWATRSALSTRPIPGRSCAVSLAASTSISGRTPGVRRGTPPRGHQVGTRAAHCALRALLAAAVPGAHGHGRVKARRPGTDLPNKSSSAGPARAEIDVAIDQPQQVGLGNLILQAEVVEQRFISGLLTIIVGTLTSYASARSAGR